MWVPAPARLNTIRTNERKPWSLTPGLFAFGGTDDRHTGRDALAAFGGKRPDENTE